MRKQRIKSLKERTKQKNACSVSFHSKSRGWKSLLHVFRPVQTSCFPTCYLFISLHFVAFHQFCLFCQIILSFYFLNDLLGLSFLVGVGVLVVLIPINTRISFMERRYQTDHLTYKDRRLKMMNELLNGIKVLSRCSPIISTFTIQ